MLESEVVVVGITACEHRIVLATEDTRELTRTAAAGDIDTMWH